MFSNIIVWGDSVGQVKPDETPIIIYPPIDPPVIPDAGGLPTGGPLMANIGKWNTPSAAATVLSVELNALGTAGMVVSTASYANQTNLDIYVDVEVNLGALSPAAGSYVSLYLAEAVDGTNFPAPTTADMRLSTTQLFCIIPTGVATAAGQRVVARNQVIPPGIFKTYFDNQTGTALAATGNTVKFLAYDVNLNG